MNLPELSQRISDALTNDLDYGEEKKEVIAYGLESLILSITGILAVLLAALVFNALLPALIAVLFGGVLRKLSGGAHFDNPVKCLAFGAVVYTLIGVLAKQMLYYNIYNFYAALVVLGLCLVTVAMTAPVDSESKPIISSSFRRKLKIASVCFVILAIIFVVFSGNPLYKISATLGIVYQTLTLLPIFNKKKDLVSSNG